MRGERRFHRARVVEGSIGRGLNGEERRDSEHVRRVVARGFALRAFDEPRHARGLLAHDAEKAGARHGIFARAALQCLDEANKRGQRRAQLMARVGDEVRPHAPEAVVLGEVAKRDHDVRRVRLGDIAGHGRERDTHAPVDRHALLDLDSALAVVLEHLVDRLQEYGVTAQERWLSTGPQERIDLARGRVDVDDRATPIECYHRVRHGVERRTPAPGANSSGHG